MRHLNKTLLLHFAMILILARHVMPGPPPVQKFTVITLYTDTMTWNDAKLFCSATGGKLLDPTYYSIYNTLFIHASLSPWKDLPITDGPQAWTSLHRRITPVGDDYYGDTCEALSEFNVIRWDTSFGPPDGPDDAMCVMHGIKIGGGYVINDYTNANCSEKHRFYCQHEEGPCNFEELTGYGGHTAYDSTANDITLAFDTVESCKERCLNESYMRPVTGYNTYTEECWGFTITQTQCIVHIVLQPRHFDSYKLYYGNRNLYIKRCFETAVNTTVLNVTLTLENSDQPNSTCGIPVLGNSTILSREVTVFNDRWTWNEAFRTCKAFGAFLLDLTSYDVKSALREFLEENNDINETLWLGLHEPDPQNYPDVRVWSDCEEESNFTWDPDVIPSTDLLDTSLCAIINTTSHVWRTVPCNEKHQFLCMGNFDSNSSYSRGTENTIGTDVSLGPYNVTIEACQIQCNSWTYKEMECRAYAYTKTADEQLCRLYFAESALTSDSDSFTPSENYTLYRKLSWKVSYMSIVEVADDSVLPYSCCDLSHVNVSASCPALTYPIYETQLPTTEATKFVLFISQVGWDMAFSTCRELGGNLVQIDGTSKRHALRYYINSWTQDGLITGQLWQGLITTNSNDWCSSKWARDCSTPHWLSINTGSEGPQYCATVDTDANTTFVNCNQSLGFICELPAGKCTMNETYTDISCMSGQYGTSISAPVSICEQSCLSYIYQGMECWAMRPLSKFYCELIYYIDPMYCKENNQFERKSEITMKNCYRATVNTSQLLETNVSHEPNSVCFSFTFPYTRELSKCGSTSTSFTSTIASTTSTLATTAVTSYAPTVSHVITQQVTTSDSSLLVTPETSTLPPVTTDQVTTSDSSISVTSETSVLTPVTTEQATTSESSISVTSETSALPPVTTDQATTSDSSISVTSETSALPPVTTDQATTSDSSISVTSETSALPPVTTDQATTSDSSISVTSETSALPPVTTDQATTSDSSISVTSETSALPPVTTEQATTPDSSLSVTSETSALPPVTTDQATTSDSSISVTSETSALPPVTTDQATTSDSSISVTSETSALLPVTTEQATTPDSSLSVTSETSVLPPFTTDQAATSDSSISVTSETSALPPVTTEQATTSDSSLSVTSETSALPPVTTEQATTSDSSISVTSETSVLPPVTTDQATTSESSISVTSETSALPPNTTDQATTSDSSISVTSETSVSPSVTTEQATTSDSSISVTSETSTLPPVTTDQATTSDSSISVTSETSALPPVTTDQATTSESSISVTSETSAFPSVTTDQATTSESSISVTSETSALISVTTDQATTSESSISVTSETSALPPVTTDQATTSDSSISVTSETSVLPPFTTDQATTSDSSISVTSETSALPPVTTDQATTSDSSISVTSETSALPPVTTDQATTSDSSISVTSETSVLPPFTTDQATTSDSSISVTSETSALPPFTTDQAATSDSSISVTAETSALPSVTTDQATTSESSISVTSETSALPPVTTDQATTSDSSISVTSETSALISVTTDQATTSDSSISVTSETSALPSVTTDQATTSDSSISVTSETSTLPPVTTDQATTSESSISVTSETSAFPSVTTEQATTSESSISVTSDSSSLHTPETSALFSVTTDRATTSDSSISVSFETSALSPLTTQETMTSDSSPPVTPETTALYPVTSQLTTTPVSSTSFTTETSTLLLVTSDSSQSMTAVSQEISINATTIIPSTSSNSVTKLTNGNGSTRIYIWPCLCNPYNKTSNLTTEQWTEWMQAVSAVTFKNTSRYRRTLTSAKDNRETSVAAGNVAIGVMLTLISLTIFTDVFSLVLKLRLKSDS